MPLHYTRYMLGLLVGATAGLGCWHYAIGHCGNLDGDLTCAEHGGGAFCDVCRGEENGCTNEMPPAGCYFSGLEGSSTGSGGTSTVDREQTTSGGQTTANEPTCTTNEDCMDPEAPFCGMTGECGLCDGTPDPGATCAEADPATPVCENGACVHCTNAKTDECDAQLLICSSESQTCIPCTEHDQCASGACDIFVGSCFDPATVIEVGGEVESIAAGLTGLDALWPDVLGQRRGVLVLRGGTKFDETATIHNGSLVYTNAEAVAFIWGSSGAIPEWTNTLAMSPVLSVLGVSTRAYIQAITIRDNEGSMGGWGIQCSDARVDIRRSRIVANQGGGILALGQCELYVANSFVGGRVDDRDAIALADADASATILYSTIGAGHTSLGSSASALRCVEGPTVDIRNSLLVALTSQPEIACPSANLTITTTASEAGGLGNMSQVWFSGYNGGDFRLTTQAPEGIRIADWQPGDPTTDIGGIARHTNDDELDYAGADVR